jgi:TetR/AcrR family transcriptional regulator, transcriptional repressor of bet genes
MPKLGMAPVRREQICRAAAKVISEQGFAGTTMRMVAEEAGVSTGMLNHYFANRMEMLEETLVFVSQRQQAREATAIEGIEPGERRLRALVRSALPTHQDSMEAWRVWIAAHGASVRLSELRRVMAARNDLWFGILEQGLEAIVAPRSADKVPYAWQLDALMNGLVIQAITTEADVSFADIENVVVATALEHGRAIAKGNGNVNPQASVRSRTRTRTTSA